MIFTRGSEWKKWDLHVHTPASIVHEYKGEDIWEKFIQELEKLPEEIKVIGINDYLFLDGYKKVIDFKNRDRLKNIDLILPVIEFRLKEFVGHTRLGRINYHIIFSDKLSTDTIEQQFLTQLYGHAKLDPETSSATWSGALSRQSLMDLGKNIKETTPSGMNTPNGSNLEIGFNNINFELSKIEELLDNSYLKDNYLKAIGKTEWDDFRWDGSTADKKTLINGCGFVFIASPTLDKSLESKNKLKENKVNSKVLHCSDAHKFYEEEYTSKVLGHCYTWIKADSSFEGLKQVIYEPEYRVKLSENCPQPPLHKLEQVKFSFDERVRWGNDKFCFAGFKEPIVFSPYLTCLIGGRGSGKSTLLNLIAEKIEKQDNNFFDKLENITNTSQYVSFTPEVVGNIEFLAQNTIEKFATDSFAFTDAIYTRIDKMSNNHLKKLEQEVINGLDAFYEQIDLRNSRWSLHNELAGLKKQLKMYSSIVKTFTDKEYIDTKSELNELQKEKIVIETSISNYKKLFEEIKALKDNNQPTREVKNNYDTYHNELYHDIKNIFEKYQNKDHEKDKEILKSLDEKIEEKRKAIENYLKEKGLSDDNIQDAQSASHNIIELKAKIKTNLDELIEVKKKIYYFDTSKIDELKDNFDKAVKNELTKINTIFQDIADKNPLEVKLIEVKYEFNENVFDKIFQDLESRLSIRDKISSFRRTFIDYISEVSLNNVLDTESGEEFVKRIPARTTQAYSAVSEVFSIDTNFQIYKLLIQKEFRNIKDNKILKVYYDDKSLDNSSFGQKCTAAIVVLISLGNNPIIIDEPEAHLDSSLIANYLVELIKQKKEQRQIIFATHNANLVLNADAELIVKLENNDGYTTIKYLTIEDTENRDDLLKLEGGKEAFKKREQKYNLVGK